MTKRLPIPGYPESAGALRIGPYKSGAASPDYTVSASGRQCALRLVARIRKLECLLGGTQRLT